MLLKFSNLLDFLLKSQSTELLKKEKKNGKMRRKVDIFFSAIFPFSLSLITAIITASSSPFSSSFIYPSPLFSFPKEEDSGLKHPSN